MNDFTKQVKAKGWKMNQLAERWGVTPRRMSQIAKDPSRKDWDAIAALPAVGNRLDLAERMKAAGMQTVDQMVAGLTANPLLLQKEVVDLESFEAWLEMEYRRFVGMQAERQLQKQDDDEMFEWILAHAAVYGDVLANFRQAMG